MGNLYGKLDVLTFHSDFYQNLYERSVVMNVIPTFSTKMVYKWLLTRQNTKYKNKIKIKWQEIICDSTITDA